MDCPAPADEFRRAVAVAIADAPIRLAQDEAECDAWAGYAQFTNGFHAVTLCRACLDDWSWSPNQLTVFVAASLAGLHR